MDRDACEMRRSVVENELCLCNSFESDKNFMDLFKKERMKRGYPFVELFFVELTIDRLFVRDNILNFFYI